MSLRVEFTSSNFITKSPSHSIKAADFRQNETSCN